jgi:hypothetical protein
MYGEERICTPALHSVISCTKYAAMLKNKHLMFHSCHPQMGQDKGLRPHKVMKNTTQTMK